VIPSKKITIILGVNDNNEADDSLGIADLVKDRAKEAYDTIKQQKQLLNNLEQKVSQYQKPVLITEGKSDVFILKAAWGKIYPDQEMPFEIISCSITSDESTAGVVTLTKYLDTVLHSESSIKIGIFDRDEEGKKHFDSKLANFSKWNDSKDIKSHKNGRAFAILLPKIEDESAEYWEKEYPCIEFLFSKQYFTNNYVQQTHYYKGDEIKDPNQVEVFKQELFRHEYSCTIKPKDNIKNHFSEKKVPTFPEDAFKNFKTLFQDILPLLQANAEPEPEI
jgi:hypothetical protein